MDPFGSKALALATASSTLLAWRARRKRSLSNTGSLTGFIVGFLLVSTGLRGFTLFFFYQIGSWATKYKKEVKQSLDATALESSVRGPAQVLAVSIVAVVLSLMHAWKCGPEGPIQFSDPPNFTENISSYLSLGVLAHHATSLGDTLASELGSLSGESPRLVIPPWRRVPAGTNGGISLAGTLWSMVGGLLCGLFTAVVDWCSGIDPANAVSLAAFGGVCGFVGSLIDSLLGATLQATYFDVDEKRVYHHNVPEIVKKRAWKHISGQNVLSNEQVNFVSIVATTIIGGYWIGPILFSATTDDPL